MLKLGLAENKVDLQNMNLKLNPMIHQIL